MNDAATIRRANLRQSMRQRRENLTPRQRMQAAQGLRHVLEAVPAFVEATDVAGYWACGGEVPLNLALASMEQRGQRYWLPRILPQRQLVFARWHSGDPVVANRYGIPEPTESAEVLPVARLNLVLVPLLAFDAAGNRLGMGGGYYDRGLAFVRTSPAAERPLLVGVAHAFQQVAQLEPQAWDIPLDLVATDQQLIDCRREHP